jgi:hypothetical protein
MTEANRIYTPPIRPFIFLAQMDFVRALAAQQLFSNCIESVDAFQRQQPNALRRRALSHRFAFPFTVGSLAQCVGSKRCLSCRAMEMGCD